MADWIDKVGRQLGHVCNGDVTKDEAGNYHCKMDNGEVIASVSPGDDVRMLKATSPRNSVSLESYGDEMVITRSLSGSIEFLHRMGNPPEVRIEQEGKKLGTMKVRAYNDDVKTSLYGYFGGI